MCMPLPVPRSMWASDLNLAGPGLLYLNDRATLGPFRKQQNTREGSRMQGAKAKATVGETAEPAEPAWR